MGRKSAKGKERKQKWKEEQRKIADSLAAVKTAQGLENPLAAFEPFTRFQRNGLDLQIEFFRRSALLEDIFNWAFDLLERNMKAHYVESDGCWKAKAKRDEMGEDVACYLVCRHRADLSPAAFVHFRFDLDDDDEVLYCYEIQVEDSVRSKGLGRHLMQILELMAFRNKMQRVVLTVFKHNKGAYNFFMKMNYTQDDTCPSWDGGFVDDREVTYEILSKSTRPKAKSEQPAAAAAPLATKPNGQLAA